MNIFKRQLLVVAILLVLSGINVANAQNQSADTLSMPSSVMGRINRDERTGIISRDAAILNKFYAIFNPSKLNIRYKMAESQQQKIVYKCITPVIIDFQRDKSQLTKRTKQTINSFIKPKISGVEQKDISPSGKFAIYYTTSGPDSVSVTDNNKNGVPDYVDWAASYADSSWDEEVKNIGFTNPVINSRPYVIHIQNLRDGFGNPIYGYTTADTLGNTQIYINNNFGRSGIPDNWDPDGKLKGAMKVTIAHELKHAIQFRVDGWSDLYETSRWLEMDATMMEDVVFDPVDDYINYLKDPGSIFSNPQYTMYPGSYQQVTWGLYFIQNYGIQFWKRVWDDIKTNHYISMKDAVSDVLKRYYQKSFNEEYTRDYLWHYAAGTRSYPGYGFKTKKRYPTARLAVSNSTVSDGYLPGYYQTRFSGIFQEIIPGGQNTGQVYVTLFDTRHDAGLGLLALKNDSTTQQIVYDSTNANGMVSIKTPWYWGNIKSLGVVTTDNSTNLSVNTRVLIGANRILYGDVNADDTLNDNDVEDIFNYVMGIKTAMPYTRYFGDVSENDTLTAYDAALIMKHLKGSLPYFKMDSNDDNRGPELTVFRTPDQLKTPVPSYKKTVKAPKTITDSEMSISIDSVAVTDNKTDARLSVSLNNPNQIYFSSLYIKIRIPSILVKDVQIDTTAGIWKNSLYKSDYNAGVFQLAIAEPDSFQSGTLFHLNLTAEGQGLANITIEKAQFNESHDSLAYHNITMMIKPRTEVSIEKKPPVPQKITLSQNYPNPFNPTTLIKFTLPDAQKVAISVYNITGQKVATLANRVYSAGIHTISFNGDNLASGIYFYQMIVKTTTGMVVKRKKMVLLK
ncbi:MAG TPA: MXAN_6640 family putative metalloprotease [Balneolales bacterium]|nr:MXAN_6640 family putative metalloprotease [Balneolales bacterium]